MRGVPAALVLASAAALAAAAAAESPAKLTGLAGGTTEMPLGDLGSRTDEATGRPVYYFVGQNLTDLRFHDFELELKGCGQAAKFHRIKVYPRAVADEEGNLGDFESDADWDVDDNLDGRSSQASAKDPDSTRTVAGGVRTGVSNETDNVDDSPDTRARVDSGGYGDPNCCSYGSQESNEAVAAGTEDGGEHKQGSSKDGKPGTGGVQPGDVFVVEMELTDAAEGGACALAIAPSRFEGGIIPPPEPPSPAAPPADAPTPTEEPRQAGEGVGLLPSACPEGQRGGLLAGFLNRSLGASFAGICDDAERQRPDRDRRHGGEHGGDRE